MGPPKAVSDPWLVQEEFPGPRTTDGRRPRDKLRLPTRPRPRPRGTVPLDFKDTATGEHFDVVQDEDLAPDPGEEPGDEAQHDRAERGVDEGGARGPTVRPALTVPCEIMDEATGEVLDVVQDNDPDLLQAAHIVLLGGKKLAAVWKHKQQYAENEDRLRVKVDAES